MIVCVYLCARVRVCIGLSLSLSLPLSIFLQSLAFSLSLFLSASYEIILSILCQLLELQLQHFHANCFPCLGAHFMFRPNFGIIFPCLAKIRNQMCSTVIEPSKYCFGFTLPRKMCSALLDPSKICFDLVRPNSGMFGF